MKKKLFLTMVVLLCAAQLPLCAATNYGIRIGGIYVTSDNNWNISGNSISTVGDDGSISYDPSSNVLTLRGARVNCEGKYNGLNILSSAKNGLRIRLEGDNYFYNFNGLAFDLNLPSGASTSSPNVYIEGTGTLVFDNGAMAVYDKAYLCIGNGTSGGAGGGGCTINARNLYCAADNSGNRGGYLRLTDGCLNLSGYSTGTLYGFTSVYNSATDMGYYPTNLTYNTSKQQLEDGSGNKVTSEAKLGWKRYGLTVGGVDVHVKNYTNIKGAAISGTVSYSPSSKQLNLNNATIDIRKRYIPWRECISNYGDRLTINVTGTCSVTRGTTDIGQDDTPAITSDNSLTFTGTGSLTVDNYSALAIKMGSGGQTLSFNNVENFKLNGKGIDMNGGTLSLNTTSLTTYDAKNIGNLKMTDTEFPNTSTTRIIWDPDQKRIRYNYNNNSPVNFKFQKVTTKYHVYIADHELNDVNANYFCYYNTSGALKAEFDSSGKSLYITMEDFTVDAKGKDNLIAEGGGCTAETIFIIPKGSNELKNPSGTAVYSYKNLFISGEGSLSVDGVISLCRGADLYLFGCTLTAKRIEALESGSTLTAWTPSVVLSGNGSDATIGGFESFELTDCAVVKPAGAYYDTATKRLVDTNGNRVTGEVSIQPADDYSLKVNGAPVNSLNADNITFSGLNSGKVSFDNETGTLTLDNVNASNLQISDISSRDTLFVVFKGQTKLDSDFEVESHANRINPLSMVVIRGSAPNSNSSLKAYRVNIQAGLMLNNCEVNATRLYYTKPDYSGTISIGGLVVDNAHVSLSGNANPTTYTLGGFKSFSLLNAHVVKPEVWDYGSGMVYKVDDPCMYDNTFSPNMEVEIVPDTDNTGDVNGDGEVGIGDIVAVTNVMAGINADSATKARADVNGDGEVGIGDIVAITNIMAGVK